MKKKQKTNRDSTTQIKWVILIITSFLLMPFFAHSSNDTKTLYLVRHAKSAEPKPDESDFNKPLNDRGLIDAPSMGKRLNKLGVLPAIIISSPSVRTKQTINLICKEIKFDYNHVVWDSTIYRCQDKDMLNAIMNIADEFESAMVVGHNNTITNLVNLFQSDTLVEEVPTCGVVAIQFKITSWSQINLKKGKLLFFEYPKKN